MMHGQMPLKPSEKKIWIKLSGLLYVVLSLFSVYFGVYYGICTIISITNPIFSFKQQNNCQLKNVEIHASKQPLKIWIVIEIFRHQLFGFFIE